MKLVNRAAAVIMALALAGCMSFGGGGNSPLEALNKAEAVGSPFTKALTNEYRSYANAASGGFSNSADSLHFARKGLAAASGIIVMPEPLDDWDLGDRNIVEMAAARAELIDALENGGRELASEKAAVAQARFDCWAEQQEENWESQVPCKSAFYDALKAVQGVVGARPAEAPVMAQAEEFPAPVTEMPKGAPVPVEQAMFITFFDWNKHNISAGAGDVLDAVAQEIKGRKDVKGVVVIGHTDTSGGIAYNKKLSLKRANAVRDGLVSRGVVASLVRVEGRGKSDLLVKTPDNVREPANRRAQITLE